MTLKRTESGPGDPPVKERKIPEGGFNSWRAAIFYAVLDGVFSRYPAYTSNCGIGEKQHFIDVEAVLGAQGMERFHCIKEGWLASVMLFVFIAVYVSRTAGAEFYSNLALLLFGAPLLAFFVSIGWKAYKGNFDGLKGFCIVSGFLGSVYLAWKLLIFMLRLLIRLLAV